MKRFPSGECGTVPAAAQDDFTGPRHVNAPESGSRRVAADSAGSAWGCGSRQSARVRGPVRADTRRGRWPVPADTHVREYRCTHRHPRSSPGSAGRAGARAASPCPQIAACASGVDRAASVLLGGARSDGHVARLVGCRLRGHHHSTTVRTDKEPRQSSERITGLEPRLAPPVHRSRQGHRGICGRGDADEHWAVWPQCKAGRDLGVAACLGQVPLAQAL